MSLNIFDYESTCNCKLCIEAKAQVCAMQQAQVLADKASQS